MRDETELTSDQPHEASNMPRFRKVFVGVDDSGRVNAFPYKPKWKDGRFEGAISEGQLSLAAVDDLPAGSLYLAKIVIESRLR